MGSLTLRSCSRGSLVRMRGENSLGEYSLGGMERGTTVESNILGIREGRLGGSEIVLVAFVKNRSICDKLIFS